MKNRIVAIIETMVIAFFAMYLSWHVIKAQRVEAAPIAGVTKHLAEKQSEARLTTPVAGASKVLLDEMTEKEEKKITRKVTYIYSSSSTLNKRDGVFYGPSGKESYYNLPMEQVVSYMRDLGYSERYWVRKDGVKMFGDRVMVAADLHIRPKGTILMTSLGEAIVCDTGAFARQDSTALDVAVAW